MRRVDIEEAIGREPLVVVELVLALQARVAELEKRLDRNSKNSSMPPSAEFGMTRAERRAKERERAKAKRSGKKPGGQPGHEGSSRKMAPPEKVTERFSHKPQCCGGCGESFNGSEKEVGDPVAHQIWELPEIDPLIFEHLLLRLSCSNCGKAQLADLPQGISPSAFGPKLQAHIAVLAGVYRLSRSQIASFVSEIFRTSISVGAVDKTLMRSSALLADPWQALKDAVRSAEVVHCDETGWRLKGAQSWLWVASSSLAACYRIDPSRSQKAAKELLGADFGAIAVTDRYKGYYWLDVLQQQMCWAHIIRQFQALSERGGAPGRFGKKLLRAAGEIFNYHREYLEGEKDLDWLKEKLSPTRKRLNDLLIAGTRSRDKKSASFCRGLLADWDALWTFCEIENVPLTNNQAERALRHPVILRKISLGSQSVGGNHWIERILSIRETCRLQKRSVLAYLTEATIAAHHGNPAPSLLPP